MATSPSIVAPTLTSPTTQPPTATSPSIQPSSPTTQPPLVDVGGLDKTIYKVYWGIKCTVHFSSSRVNMIWILILYFVVFWP